MASYFSHDVQVSKDNTPAYNARIEGSPNAKRLSIKITRTENGASEDVVEGSWIIDFDTKRFAFDVPSFQAALNATCLLGCLVGAGASIAKCIWQAKDEDEVWKCLDEHTVVLGAGAIGCVIGCLP